MSVNVSAVGMFGSSLLVRVDKIAKLVARPIRMHQFRFRGGNIDLPVVSVKINLPIYRIGNRRTKTLQEEYLIKKNLDTDFFKNEPDSIAVQQAQDEILRQLVEEKDLYDAFAKMHMQQEQPLLCTRDGVVVNGNRRLCAWRKLYAEEPLRYAHFESVEIMVLPSDTEEDDINKIERDLQVKKELKADYSWHARANMIRIDYESGNDLDALSSMYGMSRAELQQNLDCYAYAKSYLSAIGKPGQWSLVDKNDFAFQKILIEKKKISNIGEQKVFESCVAALLQSNAADLGGRKWAIIPDVAKNRAQIIEVLKRDMLSTSQSRVAVDPFGFAVGQDGHDELFRLDAECRKPENRAEVVKVVKDVIEASKLRDRDQESSHLLIDDLKSISTELIEVKNRDLDDRQVDFDGIRNQLRSIESTVKYISAWVENHAARS